MLFSLLIFNSKIHTHQIFIAAGSWKRTRCFNRRTKENSFILIKQCIKVLKLLLLLKFFLINFLTDQKETSTAFLLAFDMYVIESYTTAIM